MTKIIHITFVIIVIINENMIMNYTFVAEFRGVNVRSNPRTRHELDTGFSG